VQAHHEDSCEEVKAKQYLSEALSTTRFLQETGLQSPWRRGANRGAMEPAGKQGIPKEDELFSQNAHYLLMNTHFTG